MAMSKEEQLDLTRCSICFEIFNVPKQLPCLHSFCETCLQSYITEVFNKDIVDTKGVRCPICRTFIDKPDDQDFQEWGKHFPTNHLMNNIIDYTKSKNENTLCSVCERENESKTASHWCVNCSDALCAQCERQHRRFKLSSQHKLVEIYKMRECEPEGLLYGAEVFCDEHQSESIRFYCADHKSVCCMTCMMLRHRKCDDVGSVEDGAKTVKTSVEVETLETKLKELKSRFETLVKSREENIQRFKTKLEETKGDIEMSFDETIHRLGDSKKETLEELGAKEKEVIPKLLDEKSELECKVAGISNDIAIFESTSRHAPPARYLQTVRSLVEKGDQLETELKKQTNELRYHDLEYARNESLATFKEVEHLFGNISVSHKEIPTRTELIKTIKAGEHVTGVAFVDDKRIVGRHGNTTLNLSHINGTALHSVELSHRIWSVRMKNDREGIAVTEEKCLQFFKISRNEIILTNKLEFDATRDFFLASDGHLYIGSNGKINILDNSLKEVREILVEHRVGYMDLRDECSICYTVYQGDSHTLYCIDLDGKNLFSYSHANLINTKCVKVDSKGQIYVCGFGSKNIHQLSHEGQLQRILFEDLLSRPYCMSFNDAEDKVAIGCCDCILIYDFC